MEAEGLVAYIEDDEPNHSYEAHTHPNDEVLVAVLGEITMGGWRPEVGSQTRRPARPAGQYVCTGPKPRQPALSGCWVRVSGMHTTRPARTVPKQPGRGRSRAGQRKARPCRLGPPRKSKTSSPRQ